MIAYKLTDQNMQTHGGFQWEIDKAVETSGEGALCSSGWLHFYTHPLLAVLLNPNHAGIDNPRLFEAEVSGKHIDDYGLNIGYTRARLVREIPLPTITIEQRVEFAIRCAQKVCTDKAWNAWANKWLSGEDRSKETAWAAEVAMAETARLRSRAGVWTPQAARAQAVLAAATQAAWAVSATQAARAVAKKPFDFTAVAEQVINKEGNNE